MIIQAFVITVIGGLGNLKGAFIGALIVGILTSFGILLFPVFELFIIFVVMAIVLMVKPEDYLGNNTLTPAYRQAGLPSSFEGEGLERVIVNFAMFIFQ